MKKSICTHCYHQNNCPVDPNYKAECAPAIITTCTDYDPKQDYYEQINNSRKLEIPWDEYVLEGISECEHGKLIERESEDGHRPDCN